MTLPLRLPALAALLVLAGCDTLGPKKPEPPPPAKPVIALALGGGGAAKGFAHIGVIKALEAQGIVPDIVVGTSAGSVVGAMYAAGKNGFELQSLAITLDESQVSDWSLPDRGVVKGEALAAFINKTVANAPIEKLPKKFGAVATDLASGEPIVFRSGDTGTAVRASSSVPGVFQPVAIRGREYVDGGLVSPVPVRFAQEMGATFVIAVDISNKPQASKTKSSLDILMQTFAIMGQSLNRSELPLADVVIRPDISQLASTDFKTRHLAVLEGEKAAAQALPTLKAKLDRLQAPGPRAN